MSASRPARYGASSATSAGSTLVVLELRVERQIRAGVVQMGRLDSLDGRLAGEVAGEGARAPALETEVDGVGAGGQGRAQRARLPGRREQLDAPSGRHASGASVMSAPGARRSERRQRARLHLDDLALLVAMNADQAAGRDRGHAAPFELVEEDVDAQ